jgi:hypothetical protein
MSEPTAKAALPEPRTVTLGEWNRLVGHGATRWENGRTLGLAATAAVAPPAPVAQGTPRGSTSALRRQRRPLRG